MKPLARAERTSAAMDSGEVRLTRVTHSARTSGEGWALKDAGGGQQQCRQRHDVNPKQA